MDPEEAQGGGYEEPTEGSFGSPMEEPPIEDGSGQAYPFQPVYDEPADDAVSPFDGPEQGAEGYQQPEQQGQQADQRLDRQPKKPQQEAPQAKQGGNPASRDYLSNQNQPIQPGNKLPNPAEKGVQSASQNAAKTAGKEAAKAVEKKAGEAVAKKAAGQVAGKAAGAAAGPVGWAILAGSLLNDAKGWLKEHPWVPYAIAAVIISNTFFIMIIVAQLLGTLGDASGGVAYNAATSLYGQGVPAEMTDRLTYTKNGKTISLTLSATKGKWSPEDAAVDPGYIPSNYQGVREDLTWISVRRTRTDGTAGSGFSTDELKYYVTHRWPTFAYNWRGVAHIAPGMKASEYSEYAGKKLVVYNTRTQLCAVGIAAEAGPAPFTGVSKNVSQQQVLWGGFRNAAPDGYEGRIAGGPKYNDGKGSLSDGLGAVLEAKTDDPIIIGFAKDQNAPLGKMGSCNVQASGGNEATSGGSIKPSTYTGDPNVCRVIGSYPGVTFQLTETKRQFTEGVGGYKPMNPALCALIKKAVDSGIKPIDISYAANGTHSDGSLHYQGHAIDIGNEGIGATLMPWIIENQATLKKEGLWPEDMFGPQEYVQKYQINNGINPYTKFVGGHDNHIHIGL